MPVNLRNKSVKIVTKNLLERVIDLQNSLPDDEGLTVDEAAVKLNAQPVSVRRIFYQRKCTLRMVHGESTHMQHVLVNPKTLKKYAGKT